MLAPAPRYAPAAIALHWLMAMLVIASFVMGLLFEAVAKEWDATYLNAHAIVGATILLLVVVRLVVRFGNAPPALPADTS